MCRYAGAVHRYLLKALQDPHAADELDQEFALRFLRGDFRNCDPNRGRFRDYVKRAVQNLINDYHRRKRPVVSLDARTQEPAAADTRIADFEQQFIESWRKDLLERAWNSLAELEKNTGQPYHTVLRSKVGDPDVTSDKLALQLSTQLKKSYSAGARSPNPAALAREICRLPAHRSAREPSKPNSRRGRTGVDRLEPAALLPPIHEAPSLSYRCPNRKRPCFPGSRNRTEVGRRSTGSDGSSAR